MIELRQCFFKNESSYLKRMHVFSVEGQTDEVPTSNLSFLIHKSQPCAIQVYGSLMTHLILIG